MGGWWLVLAFLMDRWTDGGAVVARSPCYVSWMMDLWHFEPLVNRGP
uniref:Uncharacterized protein n=1 Tax=Fagus sylvatica TaxID=28930 RepID=A0A2N9G4G4_FAGSY